MSEEEKETITVDHTNFQEVIEDDVIILEPQDTFNFGIVGYKPKDKKLVYALSKLIHSFCDNNDCEYEDAVEWLYYNTIRSSHYLENYPIILEDISDCYHG